MIFVTVGTHEQQFNRLVNAIDELVGNGRIDDPVFIQLGYSDVVPAYCEWAKFISASEMIKCMTEADVVVTHGGPSSFIEAMAAGKVPVVMPRLSKYGEHINDHQETFVRLVADRQGGIVPVYDVENLADAIKEARRLTAAGVGFKSHNAEFCLNLLKRLERL